MKELYERYPILKECDSNIESAVEMLCESYKSGGKLLLCGNGGSCADCEHIVGELMKGFLLSRPVDYLCDKFKELGFDDAEYMTKNLQGSLPAVSLPHQSALISAFSNDVAPDMIYAQLVLGLASSNDVLLCLSTSGNSKNVVYAAKCAKALGIKTIAMTGKNASLLSDLCDITIQVPEYETYKIQELHLPVYHYICAQIERTFFEK